MPYLCGTLVTVKKPGSEEIKLFCTSQVGLLCQFVPASGDLASRRFKNGYLLAQGNALKFIFTDCPFAIEQCEQPPEKLVHSKLKALAADYLRKFRYDEESDSFGTWALRKNLRDLDQYLETAKCKARARCAWFHGGFWSSPTAARDESSPLKARCHVGLLVRTSLDGYYGEHVVIDEGNDWLRLLPTNPKTGEATPGIKLKNDGVITYTDNDFKVLEYGAYLTVHHCDVLAERVFDAYREKQKRTKRDHARDEGACCCGA